MFGDDVFSYFYRAIFYDNIVLSFGLGALSLQVISRKMTDAILFFVLILLSAFLSLSLQNLLLSVLSKLWIYSYQFKIYVFIASIFFSLKLILFLFKITPFQGFSLLYEKNRLSFYLILLVISIFSVPEQSYLHWSESVFVGVGYALGYGLVAILLAGLHEKLKVSEIPLGLRGTGVFLMALIFIHIGFMGLWGLF